MLINLIHRIVGGVKVLTGRVTLLPGDIEGADKLVTAVKLDLWKVETVVLRMNEAYR